MYICIYIYVYLYICIYMYICIFFFSVHVHIIYIYAAIFHARGYWPWSPTRRQCPPLVPKMGQVLYHSPLQQLGLGRYNYSILPNWIINYITNSYCWLTIVYQLVEGDYELMIFFPPTDITVKPQAVGSVYLSLQTKTHSLRFTPTVQEESVFIEINSKSTPNAVFRRQWIQHRHLL
jgi:hypothetical protein